MANSFDTSFIPQQPLLKSDGFSRRPESISLILVVALVIFFTVLAIFGGLYFYKASIKKNVALQEEKLQSREKELNIEEINKYRKINDQIDVARGLLENHKAFSGVLATIEKITAERVGWTSLAYLIADKEGAVKVELSGLAPNYRVAYAQSEQWRKMVDDKKEGLRAVEVTTPVLDLVTGAVSFKANLILEPSVIKYKPKSEADSMAVVDAVILSDIPL